MVAALRDTTHYPFTRNLVRMHPHETGIDVNTFAAAKFAIREMERLKVKSAVVYAHNMQLARAVYDLKSIAASEENRKNYKFITPSVGSTPFPCKSEQWRTRCRLCYFPRELGGRVFESSSPITLLIMKILVGVLAVIFVAVAIRWAVQERKKARGERLINEKIESHSE